MGILIDSSSLIAAERDEIDLEVLLGKDLDEEVAMSAISASELLHGIHRVKGGMKQARAESPLAISEVTRASPVSS